MLSLPTWERGLKYSHMHAVAAVASSLPTWERGLKSMYGRIDGDPLNVAPYMGAWIEISNNLSVSFISFVSLPTWERGLKLHRRA